MNIPVCGSSSEGANSGGVWVLAVLYLGSAKTAVSGLKFISPFWGEVEFTLKTYREKDIDTKEV